MKKHLVKGSIEAKRYMAKLRAKRTVGAVKKKAVKKSAPKKITGTEKMYCIKKDGLYLTRRTLTAPLTFTDNAEFRYRWSENEKKDAEKIAKHFNAKLIPDQSHKISSIKNKKYMPKKKATPKKSSTHKDTKSHNVNIRVVSGISTNDFSLRHLNSNLESIKRLEKVLLDNKEKMKLAPYKTIFWKSYFKKKNTEISNYIKTLKKNNTQIKKHIK